MPFLINFIFFQLGVLRRTYAVSTTVKPQAILRSFLLISWAIPGFLALPYQVLPVYKKSKINMPVANVQNLRDATVSMLVLWLALLEFQYAFIPREY